MYYTSQIHHIHIHIYKHVKVSQPGSHGLTHHEPG